MDDEYIKINDHTIVLPITSNECNVSMSKFFTDKKNTLSDEYPEEHSDFYDTHPGHKGHIMLKEIILNKIKHDCTG